MARTARSAPAVAFLVALVVVAACSAPAVGRPVPALPDVVAAMPSPPAESTERLPAPTPTVRPTLTPASAGITPRPTAPTREPAPVPPAWPAVAIELYRKGDFVSQASTDWCVPGAILTMVNLIEPRPSGAVAAPGQAGLDRMARSLSTDRLVGAGSEPEGWAGALNELGYGPYEVRAEPTLEAAVEAGARALRLTDRPVGLLVWRGAHAWVLAGFEANEDPAATDDFDVTHVRVADPWHPRTSSIWGPGQLPNTRIAVADLAQDYLPWRRPGVRYPEKDGRFVLVLPVVAPAG